MAAQVLLCQLLFSQDEKGTAIGYSCRLKRSTRGDTSTTGWVKCHQLRVETELKPCLPGAFMCDMQVMPFRLNSNQRRQT